eukprot:351747-Rhodomonas_salina.1
MQGGSCLRWVAEQEDTVLLQLECCVRELWSTCARSAVSIRRRMRAQSMSGPGPAATHTERPSRSSKVCARSSFSRISATI